MGVMSDGSYGTPAGVVFSFPVTIAEGKWSIVQGLNISDFAREKLDATGNELREERDEAIAICKEIEEERRRRMLRRRTI
jgi:malate dehydrogenase